jgi:GNAT superfamily N-acetyltransferase
MIDDPTNFTATEVLKGGITVTIRAIRQRDSDQIVDAFQDLDPGSIYNRFFRYKKELTSEEVKEITDVDTARVVALVVTTASNEGEILIGGGRFVTEESDSCEVAQLAFLVHDAYHRHGIASLLLKHMIRIARAVGVGRFEAHVLAENQPMLHVFRRSGLPMTQRRQGNVIHVTLTL